MAVISLKFFVCSVHRRLMSLTLAVFDFNPLGLDVGYAGPSLEEVIEADSCWCNTVIYNLMSACSECQGGESISYVQSNGTVFCLISLFHNLDGLSIPSTVQRSCHPLRESVIVID